MYNNWNEMRSSKENKTWVFIFLNLHGTLSEVNKLSLCKT